MMDKLNKFMENLKKQNPNANWANLLTGVAILVMVTVFSYAYFSKPQRGNLVIDDSKLVDQVTKGTEDATENEDKTEESQPADVTVGQKVETPAEPGEKGSTSTVGNTVVQKGEGLWHVAQRVCGDGEKYNVLAAANGLNVWEDLNEGMTLKVVCN